MDGDSPDLNNSRPRNVIEYMFQKKMRTMGVSSLMDATQQSHEEGCDGEESKGESSSSDNLLQSKATKMETEGSGADEIPPEKNIELADNKYNDCLNISIRCLRFLLPRGLQCGQESLLEWGLFSEGGFGEIFEFLATSSDAFKTMDKQNALETNIQNPEIQTGLVNACAKTTAKLIVQDIGDDFFGILVDGSHDKDDEYHLSLYLRYVDKKGMVIERLIGMRSVDGFSAVECKAAIESLLKEHSLDPSKIRGQSYNGANHLATNRDSDINSLKASIMKESRSAYHSHCFSHDLDATLANAAKNCTDCCLVCMRLVELLNLIRVACRRNEMLEHAKAQEVLEAFGACELENVRDVLKGFGLQRFDLDCGEYDHHKALLHFISKFPIIIDVLELISEISTIYFKRKAVHLLDSFFSFEFVFAAHLMASILAHAGPLNIAVRRRDIRNVLALVPMVKNLLHKMRSDEGWEEHLNKVSSFCVENDIEVPDMNANYPEIRRLSRPVKPSTNLDHFRDEIYFSVIDRELQVLDTLFDETLMELLGCMVCLNPENNFASFNKQKLKKLAEFYPDEFSGADLMCLESELDIFIDDVRSDDRFKNLKDLGELSSKLVETKKHDLYSKVYLLLKLMLILPVTAASEDRSVNAMYYVKYKLLGDIADQMFHDSVTVFVEKDIFSQVLDDDIISCFKAMKRSKE